MTRLHKQQNIVAHFLDFWEKEEGESLRRVAYSRKQALKNVQLEGELCDVISEIEKKEGQRPIIIATSGKTSSQHERLITFHSQEDVWRLKRPILFLFGTAHGLSSSVIEQCDFRLIPIEGLTDFNFLSVRSAVAVIFDRWFGCNKKQIHNKTNIS